jgi:hypothetical protein
MDCKHARLLLHFTHPRTTELEAGDAAELESHLADCPQCGALAQAERRADNRIGQAMRAVPVPDGLRTRLLAQLDAEREHWYRRRLVRAAAGLAAAAAVVLAAWLAISHLRRPVPPQLPLAGEEFFADTANPSPAKVEEGFWQQYRVRVEAPGNGGDDHSLNYSLLRYYGMAPFQGKSVPMLLFTRGNDQARVYILSYRDFDLKEAVANRQIFVSGCQIEVWPPPSAADVNNPRFAYVIIYTGDSLQPFRPPSVVRNEPLPAAVP